MTTAIFAGNRAGTLSPATIEPAPARDQARATPGRRAREIIMYGVWLKIGEITYCSDIRHVAIKDGRLTGMIRDGRRYRRVVLSERDQFYQWEEDTRDQGTGQEVAQ